MKRSQPRPAAFLLLGLSLAVRCVAANGSEEEPRLALYNWTNYTAPDLVAKFTKETGIAVSIDTYESNETVLAKLEAGGTGYDLIVVASDFVPIFVEQKLIQPVAAAAFSNFANIQPRWQSPVWDPGNRYTVPWTWGTTSVAVDTNIYKGPTDTLAVLFHPPDVLRGSVGMYGSPSEVIELALVFLGMPQCNVETSDLKQLEALLLAQKPFVKVYNTDGIVDRLASGETAISQVPSGEAFRARVRRPSLTYIMAKEGVVGWMDNLAVPTQARHPENAKRFMNFMLRPENSALLINFTGYQSALKNVDGYLQPRLLQAAEFRVPREQKVIFTPACGEKAIRYYSRIWTELRK